LLATGLLASPVAAVADTILHYGASAGIYVRDCSVGRGCSASAETTGLSRVVAFDQVDAPNLPGAHPDTTGFSAYDAGLATGPSGQQTFWNGQLRGRIGAPTINEAAYTSIDGRVSSGGWLLQRYTWDGTGPATRTISGTLTFSQSGGWPNPGGGIFDVGMSIFTTGSSDAILLDTPSCGFGGLTFDQGYTCIQNANILASTLVDTSTFGSATNATLDLNLTSITLNTSEPIFVLMTLVSFAKTGGFGDASHPFVTTFDNETGLTPAWPLRRRPLAP
jgi:hypothetical protein